MYTFSTVTNRVDFISAVPEDNTMVAESKFPVL